MNESTATESLTSLQLKQLRQLLVKHFSLEELHTLSFDLGIDFDEIGGEAKSAKVREFISYAERHGRVDDLLAEAAAARPTLPWPISASVDIPCPYLGLAAFREKDAALFFGREAFTQQMLEAVQQQSLVTVLGPSGSGKSSVVFAGLLPQLKEEDGWLLLTMRPDVNPSQSLATTLLEVLEPNLSETDWLLERRKLSQTLENETLSLEEIVTHILQKVENADKLLLVVDQFEELYTLVPDPLTRRRFIDSLLTAGKSASSGLPFKIVLTMRADFLGQALLHRPFADTLQESSLLLGPMSADELRQAIVEPARLAGTHFETGLVGRILDDVGSESGNLPLLEFALTELWSWQTNEQQLTHVAYEQIERVQGALATYADDVYEALTPEEQASTQRIFVQLVQPGLGTEDTRRLAMREEVGTENWPLVQKLADERLLVTNQDSEGRETVELIHEALIQHWQKLQGWMETDRAFRIWQERMRVALNQWQASGQDDGALLRGVPLAEAEKWLEEREDEHSAQLNKQEHEFIDASQLAEAAREQEKKAARRNQEVVFIVKWVLATTLGYAVGFAVVVAVTVAVAMGGAAVGAVFGALVGAVFGAAVSLLQWFVVLRGEIDKASWWILASTLGGAVGSAVGGAVDGAVDGAVGFAVGGAVVGLLQWFVVLRGEVDKASWWILATTLGGAVVGAAVGTGGIEADVRNFGLVAVAVGSAVVGAVVGLITGFVLVWLLRHRK